VALDADAVERATAARQPAGEVRAQASVKTNAEGIVAMFGPIIAAPWRRPSEQVHYAA
jgi:hypothetical protein